MLLTRLDDADDARDGLPVVLAADVGHPRAFFRYGAPFKFRDVVHQILGPLAVRAVGHDEADMLFIIKEHDLPGLSTSIPHESLELVRVSSL